MTRERMLLSRVYTRERSSVKFGVYLVYWPSVQLTRRGPRMILQVMERSQHIRILTLGLKDFLVNDHRERFFPAGDGPVPNRCDGRDYCGYRGNARPDGQVFFL